MAMVRLLILALGIITLSVPAAAQEQVRIRGWSHADFGRIVFDWPQPVKYEAGIDGKTLSIRFERPLTADFANALELLSGYVTSAGLSSDNRTANFQLKGDFGLKTFTTGQSVVVDVVRKAVQSERLPSPARPTSAASAKTAEGFPALNVRTGEHDGYDRLVFDWTRPVEYKVDRDGHRVTLKFSRPATIDIADLRARLDRSFTNPGFTVEGGELVFTIDLPETARLRHFHAGSKVVLDALRAVGQPEPARAPERAKAAQKVAEQPRRPEPPSGEKVATVPPPLSAPATKAPVKTPERAAGNSGGADQSRSQEPGAVGSSEDGRAGGPRSGREGRTGEGQGLRR